MISLDARINNALILVELDYPILSFLRQAKSQSEVDGMLAAFKDRVKKQRRILARKYHPDICQDPGNRMKTVNEMCDFLLNLKGRFNPPPPPVRFTMRFYYSHYSSSGTSNSTNDFYSWTVA